MAAAFCSASRGGGGMPQFFDVNWWLTEPYYWLASSFNGDEEKHAEVRRIGEGLEEAGISRAIVTHRLALGYDWHIGNERLLSSKLCGTADNLYHAFILAPDVSWRFDLDEYLDTAYRNRVRLFRFYPRSHLFHLNDAYMQRIFRALEERRFPVMLDLKQLDITGNKYFDIDLLERVLRGNPDLPVILETTLKQCMFSRFFFPLLEAFPNLFLEVSGLLLVDQIEGYVDRYGAGRLVFGTNAPSVPAALTTSRLILADLDDRDRTQIASGNLETILGGIRHG